MGIQEKIKDTCKNNLNWHLKRLKGPRVGLRKHERSLCDGLRPLLHNMVVLDPGGVGLLPHPALLPLLPLRNRKLGNKETTEGPREAHFADAHRPSRVSDQHQ